MSSLSTSAFCYSSPWWLKCPLICSLTWNTQMTTEIYAAYHKPPFFFSSLADARSSALLAVPCSVWSGAAVAAEYLAVNRDIVLLPRCETWAFRRRWVTRGGYLSQREGLSSCASWWGDTIFLKFWRCLFPACARVSKRQSICVRFFLPHPKCLLSVLWLLHLSIRCISCLGWERVFW